jgi:hypothetical protein
MLSFNNACNGFLHRRYFECECLMGIITTQKFGVQFIFTKYMKKTPGLMESTLL